MPKSTLPENIVAQSYGLTGEQVTQIELLGAMLDRARASSVPAATARIEPDGSVELSAEFKPIIIASDEDESEA